MARFRLKTGAGRHHVARTRTDEDGREQTVYEPLGEDEIIELSERQATAWSDKFERVYAEEEEEGKAKGRRR